MHINITNKHRSYISTLTHIYQYIYAYKNNKLTYIIYINTHIYMFICVYVSIQVKLPNKGGDMPRYNMRQLREGNRWCFCR